MRSHDGVYRNPTPRHIPPLDLLTFLFDSEYSYTSPADIVYADAERPSIHLNKAGLQRLIEEFAYGLCNEVGVGAQGPYQDVVVIFSTGQVAYPAALFSVIAAGGVASLASSSYKHSELARQINQSNAKVLIASRDVLHVAREAVASITDRKVTILVLESDPDFNLHVDGKDGDARLRSIAVEHRLSWSRITDRDELDKSLVALLYSAGTTGEPKGVMLSHTNLVAQAIIADPLTTKVAERFPIRTLAHLEPAHITAVNLYMLNPVRRRGLIFWMRKYEWIDFLRYSRILEPTFMATVPSIWLRIIKDPQVTDHFKSLRLVSGGAAPFDGKLQKAVNQKMGRADMFAMQVYGSSENTGALTVPNFSAPQPDSTGSIGVVVPNSELRLVDGEFNDVSVGTPGQIISRGPCHTRGYFRNPELTDSAFHEGWYCSGDVAVERNGKLYIVDRIKDVIKFKGLQIAPAEIESTLTAHPEILEAAVVGIPDALASESSDGTAYSEIPRAYVVAARGYELNAEMVKGFVKDELAAYKQLRGGIVFVEELPKSVLGKLLRRQLRQRAIEETRGKDRRDL